MSDKAKRNVGGGNGSSRARTAPRPAGNGQVEMVTAMNGANMEAFAKACQACLGGWATINGELAGFMSRRLNRDAELIGALAHCTTFEEAAGLQRDWAQAAAEDYAEETGRLMELTSSVAAEQWKPVLEPGEVVAPDVGKTGH